MRRVVGNAQFSVCPVDGNLEDEELQSQDELREWYTQTFQQALPANAPYPFTAVALLHLPSDLAKRRTAVEGTGVKGFENPFDS